MKWLKLNKNGTVGSKTYDHPPELGVGVAQIDCPHFSDDRQITLNYVSLDGQIIGVRLCRNGLARNEAYKNALTLL